jgi:hypothetical protein
MTTIILGTLVFLACAVMLAAYLTNPFNKITIIRKPFRVRDLQKGIVIDRTDRMTVRRHALWRWFAVMKCGLHILHTRYIRSPRSRAKTVQGIIDDIHKRRFRPNKLLLISGDHFSALFVRNLGVFYYPTLDARIPDDWQNRQVVYLQTVAYALAVFAKSPIPATTIVSTRPYSATCVNFYAYPSDTVYGVLYALSTLSGIESAIPSEYGQPLHRLETSQLAKDLCQKFATTLQKLYAHYRQTAYDEQMGLISTAIHLSGAKDITRRQSSFYDNVIFWKTTQLAMKLGLITDDIAFLSVLKKRIIKTFWLEEKGYFLEDLSEEGKANTYYSSDWLIVLATGFLDITDSKERPYYERSVAYIRQHKIDLPFPLKYQADTRAHRQFLAVRLAVASYGGDAIWSFWGMEYIKVLLLLYISTGDKSYLRQADKHIASYETAMLENGGFPETYDPDGTLLQTPFYRSIRQTGWVIGFEQVQAMRKSIM